MCVCVCVCVYKFARYTIHIVCLYRVSSLCVVSAECVCVCVCVFISLPDILCVCLYRVSSLCVVSTSVRASSTGDKTEPV